jgi:hypothetical protein
VTALHVKNRLRHTALLTRSLRLRLETGAAQVIVPPLVKPANDPDNDRPH